MKCLIDADILIYRAAFAIEKQCYKILFPNKESKDLGSEYTKTQIRRRFKEQGLQEDKHYKLEGYKTSEPVENALHLCSMQINKIINRFRTTDYQLYLTSNDKSNYRFAIAKTPGASGLGYKAGRPSKPINYEEVREYLLCYDKFDHTTIEVKGCEADDQMGIDQTNNTVICTIDKDLDMIPGRHYNFVTDDEYVCSDPGELRLDGNKLRGSGVKWFYAQMLLGDNCDNIPGINGIGPVRAAKLLEGLQTEEEMVAIVWEVYYSKFKEDANDRFLEVADLLWIQREEGERKSKHLGELLCKINQSKNKQSKTQQSH